jgi:hypothetical protein
MNYLKIHHQKKPWTRKNLQEEQKNCQLGMMKAFPFVVVQISKAAGKY